MRINKFLAQATGISRRAADKVIADGLVLVNGQPATTGSAVGDQDTVSYNGKNFTLTDLLLSASTILLNKPAGYVVSRDGQGSRTIYELLPPELHHLKPIGRLDKDSSGLLLLTTDGELANQLTHPRYKKTKRYEIRLASGLQPLHRQMINDYGIQLDDGPSRLTLERLHEANDNDWLVIMHEGRNRQIRRTFAALGYSVTRLQRTQFGDYWLEDTAQGMYRTI